MLFGDEGTWAKADMQKARLCPTEQAVAGVLRPKENKLLNNTDRRNASSIEGGIFGRGRVTSGVDVPKCTPRGGGRNMSSIEGGILTWK